MHSWMVWLIHSLLSWIKCWDMCGEIQVEMFLWAECHAKLQFLVLFMKNWSNIFRDSHFSFSGCQFFWKTDSVKLTPFCYVISGYESHQFIWHHQRSAVRILHRAILWASVGSTGVGSTQSKWDGRSSTDAKWLLAIPGNYIVYG